jgi:hypothetical protein
MKQHGGKRKGAGRHLKYGEQTEIVRFSVPKSKVDFIKKLVHKALKAFEIKKGNF